MRRLWTGLAVFLIALVTAYGCSGGREPAAGDGDAGVAQLHQAMHTAELPAGNARTLGFESPELDWTASSGTVASSEESAEGDHSLRISGFSQTRLTSAPLSTLSAPSNVVGFDLLVPTPSPDPSWWGSVNVYIHLPSAGFYSHWVGQANISPVALDRFRRIEFVLPPAIVTALSGSYSDLQVFIDIQGPSSASHYLVDRLTFSHEAPEPPPSAPSAITDRVLGFESIGDWAASSGTTALADALTEGSYSLAVSDTTYTDIVSARVGSLGAPLADELTLDVWRPAENDSPWWAGSVQVSVDLPSAGLSWVWVGTYELSSQAPGSLNRARMALPPEVKQALQGQYSDLRFKIAANLPANSGTHGFDRLDVGQEQMPPEEEERVVHIVTPPGVQWHDLAVGPTGAPNRMSGAPFVGENAVIYGQAEPDFLMGRVYARGTTEWTVAQGAQIGDVWSTAPVTLLTGAKVDGAIRTFAGASLGTNAEATEGVFDGVDVVGSDIANWVVEFPAPGPDVENPAATITELAPGSYGDLFMSGGKRVVLRAGTYYFQNFNITKAGELQFDTTGGQILIHVAGIFQVDSTSTFLDGTRPWDVFVTAWGEQGAQLGKPLHGTVIAPNGTVNLSFPHDVDGDHGTYHGSYFGKRVVVGAGVLVDHSEFIRPDCAAAESACQSVVGCPRLDADADGIRDCEEAGDADTFTDPGEFNGMHARRGLACSPSVSCEDIRSRDDVEACLDNTTFDVEKDLYAGWDWRTEGNDCNSPMQAEPHWPSCGSHQMASDFLVDFQGFIKFTQAGTHCFDLTGSTDNACAALFFNDAEQGTTTTDDAVCFDVTEGVYPIQWFVQIGSGTERPEALHVNYCFSESGACEPTEPLPSAMLRTEFEGSSECVEGATCSRFCECDTGGACETTDQCLDGLACLSNACRPLDCADNPHLLGCGYPGAPCGEICTTRTGCESDADCPSSETCGFNGDQFGEPGKRFCWDPECETVPKELGCGSVSSKCGLCECEPSCENKQCGDEDLSDGCGGRCASVCDNGEPNCQSDTDCQPGSVCVVGGGPRKGLAEGVNVCLPALCRNVTQSSVHCGAIESLCGICPVCVPQCEGRECGLDPICGVECGSTCANGELCTAEGKCTSMDETPPITVVDPDGTTRSITPPESPPPTDVGAVAGTFSVSDRGSATYSIPIVAAPGRAGIQPELSLRYSSSTGNGALGIGWSLDGLSTITRCQRTYAQDGYSLPIQGTTADAYCLDGKRLVGVAQDEYRTEIDTFTKVVAHHAGRNEPDHFVAYTKDGRVLHYGSTRDAKAFTTAGQLETQPTVTRTWALNRVQDRAGNFMTISYAGRTGVIDVLRGEHPGEIYGQYSTAEFLPDAITYTGHAAGGSETPGNREIRFHYTEGRPDERSGYSIGGGLYQRKRLLQRVDVLLKGQSVRSYLLKHETAQNDVSVLTELRECTNAQGLVCKPPTTFDYYEEQGFEPAQQLFPEEPFIPFGIAHLLPAQASEGNNVLSGVSLKTNVTRKTPLPGEVEFGLTTATAFIPGAGSLISTAISLANGFLGHDHETRLYERFQARFSSERDPNVDWFDLGFVCHGRAMPNTHILVGPGGTETLYDLCPTSSTETVITRSLQGFPGPVPAGEPYEAQSLISYTPRVWFTDVEGDGIQDKLYCSTDGTLNYKLSSTDRSGPPVDATVEDRDGDLPGWGNTCRLVAPDCVPRILGLPCQDVEPFSFVFDVDGDGTGNLLIHDEEEGWGALVFGPTGPHWEPRYFGGFNVDPTSLSLYPIDLNGDGLRDVLGFQSGAPTPILWLNTGDAFAPQQVESDAFPFDISPPPEYPAFVTDYDRDGVEELIHPTDDPDGALCYEALSGATDQVIVFPQPDVFAFWRCMELVRQAVRSPKPWVMRSFREGQLKRSLLPGETFPGTLGDFDGDGNPDLLTRQPGEIPIFIHYGTGRRQNLLKTVTDGLGRQVEVKYDRENSLGDVYEKEDFVAEWPLRIEDTVTRPLVSAYQAAHYLDRARTSLKQDGSVEYQYLDSRVDLAGYGWLGFQTRIIEERDALGELVKRTRIDYDDSRPVTQTAEPVPYTYPFAGLVTSVNETFPPMGSALIGSMTPDMNRMSTDSIMEWQTQTSTAGRVFPYLKKRVTRLRNTDNISRQSQILTVQTETFEVDSFGNVRDVVVESEKMLPDYPGEPSPPGEDKARVHITTLYEPTPEQISSWLISLPTEQMTRAERSGVATTRYTHFEYYESGLLRKTIQDPGNPGLTLTTTLVRDALGNVEQVISAGPDETRDVVIGYDPARIFPTSITNAKLHTTQMRIDERFGQLAVRVDPNGIDETWSYDAFGRLRTYRGPGGALALDYQFADLTQSGGLQIPAAYRVVSTPAGGAAVEEEYSALGQLVRRKSQGFQGATILEEFEYDLENRLSRKSRPHLMGDFSQGLIQYEYDPIDRLIRTLYPDGAEVRQEHSLAHSLDPALASNWLVPGATSVTRVTDPRGHQTVVVKDRLGMPLQIIDALDARTRYARGANGEVLSMFAPAGDVTSFLYDNHGRLISKHDPVAGDTTAQYNAFGELEFSRDNADRESHYFYDVLGRLERLEDNDGVTQWIYDGAGPNEIGRLVETISPSGQRETYAYEPPEAGANRGLLRQVSRELIAPDAPSGSAPQQFVSHFVYDNFSRLLRTDYPSAAGATLSVTNEFDAVGNVERIYNTNDPAQTYWELLEADQGYRIKREQLGNGVVTERAYQPLTGRLARIISRKGEALVQDLTYGYDLAGNLTFRRAQDQRTFLYDELNRLTDVVIGADAPGDPSFRYDPLRGQLEFKAGVGNYTYDPARPMNVTSVGSNQYDHDALGNMRTRSGPNVPGGTQTIDYTTFDLPSRITSGEGTEATITDYAYNASGSRVIKQTADQTTFYAGEAYQAIQQTASPGTVEHRHMIYAGGRAIAQLTRNETNGSSTGETLRYLHDDLLGSVHIITDPSGTALAERTYQPFGAAQTPLGNDLAYGFTGHEHETDQGLINMKGRMYDPVLGQFLTPDPIMQAPYSQGLNRYAYAFNSPLNYVDPSGYSNSTLDWALSGAVIGGGYGLIGYGIASSIVSSGGATAASAGGSVAASAAVSGGSSALSTVSTLGSVGAVAGSFIKMGFFGNQTVTSQSVVPTARSVAQSAGTPNRGATAQSDFAPVTEGTRSAATARSSPPIPDGEIVPGEPITDPKVRRALWDAWIRSDLGSERAHEEGITMVARFVNGERVFDDPERWEPSISLAEARRTGQVPTSRMPRLRPGARQYVTAHTHPFPEGTMIVDDPVFGRQLAQRGPSIGDIVSTQIQRDLGYNVVDYVVTPEGIYRTIGVENVQRIAPIGYINPVSY